MLYVMLTFWLRRSGALERRSVATPPPGGGVLPYIGMCRPNGYGFSAVLVINRVSILANFLAIFSHK